MFSVGRLTFRVDCRYKSQRVRAFRFSAARVTFRVDCRHKSRFSTGRLTFPVVTVSVSGGGAR